MRSPSPKSSPSPKPSPPPPLQLLIPESDPSTDCSLLRCSPYCLQWCPTSDPNSNSTSNSSSPSISPLLIALITALAAALLLLSYYTFSSRLCRSRRRRRRSRNHDPLDDERRLDHQAIHDMLGPSVHIQPWALPASVALTNSDGGLNDAFIKSITAFKYKSGDGLVDATDCAVCLTEFREEETLRLMPNCQHAFHPPCIDTWLREHSNCPICRALMVAGAAPDPAPAAVASRLTVERGDDVVVVVVDVVAQTATVAEGEVEVDVEAVVGDKKKETSN